MKRPIRSLQRWREIQAILLRYGFDMFLDQNELREARRFLRERLSVSIGEFEDRSLPQRLRLMLQDLGPTYVKLGQMLAGRRDLLPDTWIAELAKLQDDVAPFTGEEACAIIEAELGAPPDELFSKFDPTPIAAASIGQVHQARLPDRRLVVVKIRRPGIVDKVRADLDIIRELARILEEHLALARQYGAVGIAESFAQSLQRELDFRNEARHAERLSSNMRIFPEVHVPAITWEMVTEQVLVMERIKGVKISDREGLLAAGADMLALADSFIRSICQQILVDGFFHGDPHPGNIFYEPSRAALVFLDLGMMGRLTKDQRRALVDLVFAIGRRDAPAIVDIATTLGTPYKPVDRQALAQRADEILDQYLSVSVQNLMVTELLGDIMDMLVQQGIRLPESLAMATKALVQTEEVAHILNPKIEMGEIVHSVMQQITRERLQPDALAGELAGQMRTLARLTRTVPGTVETLFSLVRGGKLPITLESDTLSAGAEHLTIIANRLVASVVLAGVAIGSAIAMGHSPDETWDLIPLLGVIGFVATLIVAIFLGLDAIRDMHKVSKHQRKRDRDGTAQG